MTPKAGLAFARYRAIAHRLPKAVRGFPPFSARVPDLRALFGRYDGFILDAYGVLNVGTAAIPGAAARIAEMRAAGKRLVVLTNGASQSGAAALARFHHWGFDFTADEVIASRDLVAEALRKDHGGLLWAAIGADDGALDDLPGDLRPLDDDLLTRAEGFVFLGSGGWSAARQAALLAALRADPRPVICANPDIVAPRETGFTWEPGHFAHDLPGTVQFHGKPFGGAFDEALRRLALPASRVAMVGDTLHTDVLGGRAAGCFTVLITGQGFFAGIDPQPFIAASGITPDFMTESL